MRNALVPLALVLASVSLVATFVAGLLAKQRYEEAARWVAHTGEVGIAVTSAREHLDDARVAELLGESREHELEQLEADVRTACGLTVDNRRQQERCVDVQRAIAAWRGGGDMDEAQARETLDDMKQEEVTLFAVRTAEQRAASRWRAILFGTSAALTVVFGALGVVVLQRQRRALAESEALLRTILESMGDAVLAVDNDRRFVVANAVARRLFDRVELGSTIVPDWAKDHRSVRVDGSPLDAADGAIGRALRGEASDSVRFAIQRPGATEPTWLRATGRSVRDEDGAILGAVAVYHDITVEKERADRLEAQSITDELTGLLNRRGFLATAEPMARAAARTGRPYAVLFADLNGLKKINDALGHEVGDRAIRHMAEVLARSTRATDVAARLGGDEFVVLLAGADERVAEGIEARVRHELALDEARAERDFRVSVSVGMAFATPEAPRTVSELLQQADAAMYANKRERRDRSLPVLRSA